MTGADRPRGVSDRPTDGPEDFGRLLRTHFRAVADDFPASGQLAAVTSRTATMRPRPGWLVILLGGPSARSVGAPGGAATADPSEVAWPGAPHLGTSRTQHLALALVLVGLLLMAVVGAAVVGGLLQDSLRGVVPTHSASPEPTRAPEIPVMAETYNSERYGFLISYPSGWQTTPATTTWDGFGPRAPSDTDQITQPGTSGIQFSVLSDPISPDLPVELRAERVNDYLLSPPELRLAGDRRYCDRGSVRSGFQLPTDLPETTVVAEDLTIGGLAARLHSICGHVDALLWARDRVFILSLVTPGRVDGDIVLFKAFAATFELADPAPRPSPLPTLSPSPPPSVAATETFQSAPYRYSIELPGAWTAMPATQPWNGDGRPIATAADAFVGPSAEGSSLLAIAARAKPAEISEDRFVADVAPLPGTVRTNGPAVHCVFGDTIVERGPIPLWETEVIGGHQARVRSMCGTVDAVVFVGDRGYIFSLVSGLRTVGDIERFRQLVASVRFDDGLETFVSDAYGYSIRFPGDWQLRPTKVPWDGTGTANDGMDWFFNSGDGPTARFTVAARALSSDTTEDAWIETYVPRLKELFGKTCRFGSTHVLAPDADASWQPATIDGRDARVRAACGRIDGVVFTGGIGYWLRLSTSERRTGADIASFDRLADTIDLDAVRPSLVTLGDQQSSTPSKAFTSDRYGYSIRIPRDWTVTAAPKRAGGEALEKGRTADEFAEPLEVPRRFSVMAHTLNGAVVDETWLATYVPDPRDVHSTICRQADGTPKSALQYMSRLVHWTETVIAGRPARTRGVCGQIQAVIQVGDTAFVLTSFRSDMDREAFRRIADTFRIAP